MTFGTYRSRFGYLPKTCFSLKTYAKTSFGRYSALPRLAPETWSRLAGLILGPPNHSGAHNFENEGTLLFERMDQGMAGGLDHFPNATGILADEVGS